MLCQEEFFLYFLLLGLSNLKPLRGCLIPSHMLSSHVIKIIFFRLWPQICATSSGTQKSVTKSLLDCIDIAYDHGAILIPYFASLFVGICQTDYLVSTFYSIFLPRCTGPFFQRGGKCYHVLGRGGKFSEAAQTQLDGCKFDSPGLCYLMQNFKLIFCLYWENNSCEWHIFYLCLKVFYHSSSYSFYKKFVLL